MKKNNAFTILSPEDPDLSIVFLPAVTGRYNHELLLLQNAHLTNFLNF